MVSKHRNGCLLYTKHNKTSVPRVVRYKMNFCFKGVCVQSKQLPSPNGLCTKRIYVPRVACVQNENGCSNAAFCTESSCVTRVACVQNEHLSVPRIVSIQKGSCSKGGLCTERTPVPRVLCLKQTAAWFNFDLYTKRTSVCSKGGLCTK